MGMTASILYAAQEQSGTISETSRARIEYAIDWIGPVRGCQNGVEFVTLK